MTAPPRKLNLAEVTAIGIGGMVGGGIFAVLGLAIEQAGHAVPGTLAVGGVIALLTGLSYAHLGLAFHGDGGSFTYIEHAFGQPSVFDANNALLPGGTAVANRFLLTGREWNPLFKFYEYRARAYSPALGRCMSEDPQGFDAGDDNLYRYVPNDPLDRSDPLGLDFDV